MKKIIRNNLVGFILGFSLCFCISAGATTLMSSSSLEYDNGESVEEAIDDLYQKADELYGYHVGDEITLAGDKYYVIADSPAIQDYVVALKDEPITSNISNGGDSYDESPLKTTVDNWATATFINNELKEVNGYSARMITKDEYEDIPDNNSWKDSCNYYTMTHVSIYWCAVAGGSGISCYFMNGLPYAQVRPVINVYKSAITK